MGPLRSSLRKEHAAAVVECYSCNRNGTVCFDDGLQSRIGAEVALNQADRPNLRTARTRRDRVIKAAVVHGEAMNTSLGLGQIPTSNCRPA